MWQQASSFAFHEIKSLSFLICNLWITTYRYSSLRNPYFLSFLSDTSIGVHIIKQLIATKKSVDLIGAVNLCRKNITYDVIHDMGPDFIFPSKITIDDECSSNFVEIRVTCKDHVCPNEISFRIQADGLSKRFYVARYTDGQ